MTVPSRPDDTTADAERVQIALLRAAPVSRRLRVSAHGVARASLDVDLVAELEPVHVERSQPTARISEDGRRGWRSPISSTGR